MAPTPLFLSYISVKVRRRLIQRGWRLSAEREEQIVSGSEGMKQCGTKENVSCLNLCERNRTAGVLFCEIYCLSFFFQEK